MNEKMTIDLKDLEPTIKRLREERAESEASDREEGREEGRGYLKHAGFAEIRWFERKLEESVDGDSVFVSLRNDRDKYEQFIKESDLDDDIDPETYWHAFAEGLVEAWDAIRHEVEKS